MTNPELADKILRVMLYDNLDQSEDIAAKISEPHRDVMGMMKFLESQYPQHYQGNKPGYGDSVSVSPLPAAEATLKALLDAGGYTAQEKRNVEGIAKKEEREALQDEALKAIVEQAETAKEQVEQLKKQVELKANQVFDAESSAKSARTWSWVGAIIAGVSAVAAVIALFKGK